MLRTSRTPVNLTAKVFFLRGDFPEPRPYEFIKHIAFRKISQQARLPAGILQLGGEQGRGKLTGPGGAMAAAPPFFPAQFAIRSVRRAYFAAQGGEPAAVFKPEVARQVGKDGPVRLGRAFRAPIAGLPHFPVERGER